MNRTMISSDSVLNPPLQRTQFFTSLISSGNTHAAGDRGGISGDLTDFSYTNWALRAVKKKTECDKSHEDLTRQCKRPSLRRAQFFFALNSPGSSHAAESSWHFRLCRLQDRLFINKRGLAYGQRDSAGQLIARRPHPTVW
jgi:hypothetical protein